MIGWIEPVAGVLSTGESKLRMRIISLFLHTFVVLGFLECELLWVEFMGSTGWLLCRRSLKNGIMFRTHQFLPDCHSSLGFLGIAVIKSSCLSIIRVERN